MLGPRLGTIHNMHYYQNLMSELRKGIDEDELDATVARINQAYADDVS